MGQALYRKYRSKSLDEVVGQSHITDMLRRAIASGNVAHAYLLTGPKGVGKTSIARILAHEINRLPYTDESAHLDIIEIDAASNNSVEDIRNLRDKVAVAPTSAPKKIYIIDEVHMIFTGFASFVNNYSYNANVLQAYNNDLKLLSRNVATNDQQNTKVQVVTTKEQEPFYTLVAHYDKRFVVSTEFSTKQTVIMPLITNIL